MIAQRIFATFAVLAAFGTAQAARILKLPVAVVVQPSHRPSLVPPPAAATERRTRPGAQSAAPGTAAKSTTISMHF